MIRIWYWKGHPNAGDYFGKWLLDSMDINNEYSENPDICISGSILNCKQAYNAKIWGLGYHTEFEHHNYSECQIYAVRGKLTEKKLCLSKKVVTGDPGILASKFYKVTSVPKYKFGIIVHYVDEQFFNNELIGNRAKIIKIGTNDCKKVLDDICECEFIFSSSLHGIVFAHSYGIPAVHVIHNALYSPTQFKFRDYYSNFNMEYNPIWINTQKDFNCLLDYANNQLCCNKYLFVPSKNEIDNTQRKLLKVFPLDIKNVLPQQIANV